MLFLKFSQVFLFIYLFLAKVRPRATLIAATIMNWLQLNNWRGEDKGASIPPPFLYSEPSISPLKSVFCLAQTLLVSMSKSFALQNTRLLCTLPVKLFSVIALASHCGSVHSSLGCREAGEYKKSVGHDAWWCSSSYQPLCMSVLF